MHHLRNATENLDGSIGSAPGLGMSSLLSRITIDPEVCHGKPCVCGLRYPVESILEYLAAGDSFEAILGEFPDLALNLPSGRSS